jgi:hypothetical protein
VCFVFLGKAQETNFQNIDAENDDYLEEIQEYIAYEKFWQQKSDSVCVAIKNSEKSNISERAKVINGIFDVGRCWYTCNRDSLIAVSLSSLMIHPDIVNYNIEKILRNDEFLICHSKDNRVSVFGWVCDCAAKGTSMEGLICVRNKNNQPQSCLYELPYFSDIYKLRSKKDLYLLQNYSCLMVVELTDKGINLDYPAFKIENKIYESSYNRVYTDRCGVHFDEKTQKLTIGKEWYDLDENGKGFIDVVLQFNGKEFVKVFESTK